MRVVPGGEGTVNATTFAIFALAPIEEPEAQAPLAGAAAWIEANQRDNGGWAWENRNSPDEVDLTGAALQALIAAGRADGESVREGIAYLHKAQNQDGGFPEYPGEAESNAASTAWATQAIWAAGENPEEWLTGSGGETEEPLDYLESLQAGDGHIAWKKNSDVNGVWMTAYAAPAFAGQAWPIPFVPPGSPSADPKPGEGGSQAGAGVIAGGGGRGAPLFSRPKPQSKGRTPGGARVLHGSAEATDRSRTRRGENTQQTTATQGEEATGSGAGGAPAAFAQSSGTAAPATSTGTSGGGGSGAVSRLAEEISTNPGGRSQGSETQVTGTLVGATGSAGEGDFGAPGLHGAGVDPSEETAVAIAIGAAALLVALGGAQWERRRGEAIL